MSEKFAKSVQLEKPLIDFAARVYRLSRSLETTAAGGHVSRQILRSAMAAPTNYAEARAAESDQEEPAFAFWLACL